MEALLFKTSFLSAALVGCVACSPAFAACDDYWFVRNAIFDEAGFCFGSALGQAVFGNGDCTTKSPQLGPDAELRIVQIKEMEAEWQCAVDSTRTALDLHSVDLRRKLETQPLRDITESSCIGYTGLRVPLFAGQDAGSAVIGYLPTGADFYNAHVAFAQDDADWTFISGVSIEGSQLPDIGWTNATLWEQCTAVAG